jgi:CRP-like cAMP-binding protein
MSAPEAERSKRGLVLTRSGEEEAPPILIFHRGEVMKVHVWASNSGRVRVSFLAAKGEWEVVREEILNRGRRGTCGPTT